MVEDRAETGASRIEEAARNRIVPFHQQGLLEWTGRGTRDPVVLQGKRGSVRPRIPKSPPRGPSGLQHSSTSRSPRLGLTRGGAGLGPKGGVKKDESRAERAKRRKRRHAAVLEEDPGRARVGQGARVLMSRKVKVSNVMRGNFGWAMTASRSEVRGPEASILPSCARNKGVYAFLPL